MRTQSWKWALFVLVLWSAPAWARVHILHGGQTQGVASYARQEVTLPYVLFRHYFEQNQLPLSQFDVSQSRTFFHYQGHYLWGDSLDIDMLNQFLESGGLEQKPQSSEELTILHTADALSFSGNSSELVKNVDGLKLGIPHRAETATLRILDKGIHVLSTKETPFSTNPTDWEMILGHELDIQHVSQAHKIMLIAKAQGEASRRLAWVNNRQKPETLVLDSGNTLEGLSSVKQSELSLQRPNSHALLQKMGLDALVVGKTELRGGLDTLEREQKKFQLPLVSANLKRGGQWVFPPYRILTSGQKKVAVVGLSDAQALRELQERNTLPEDLDILGPEEALKQAMDALDKDGITPDYWVLVSNAPLESFQDLVLVQRDFQVVLTSDDERSLAQSASYSRPLAVKSRPLVLSHHPDAQQEIVLETQETLLKVTQKVRPIRHALRPDLQTLRQIQKVRHQAYKADFDTLIPNLKPILATHPALQKSYQSSAWLAQKNAQLQQWLPRHSNLTPLDVYPPHMTREFLATLELNLLLEAFQSEAAVLRLSPKMDLPIPGAVPRFLVYDRLRTDDTLALYFLSGKQLKALYGLKPKYDFMFGGLNDTGEQVRGRAIEDKVFYKVILPSSVVQLSAVQEVLGKTRQTQALHNVWTGERSENPYLRGFILKALDRLHKHRDFDTRFATLLAPQWHDKQNLWRLTLGNVQLNVSGYNAMNNQNYTTVRETRVTNPDSYTFGGKGIFALGFDNAHLGWINSVNSKFEGRSILEQSDENFTENQDDLLFSSELQLNALEFSLAALKLRPYVEGTYDTEFTPTVNKDTQQTNPRQSELSGILGLQLPNQGWLKTFKTGLAVKRDFNVPNNIELGPILQTLHQWPLTDSLTWNNDLNAKYFFPSPNDNETSLGVIVQYVSSFDIALTQNLTLNLYADSYLFRGKLPSTSDIGASVILGVGLNYGRVWKPQYEPLLF